MKSDLTVNGLEYLAGSLTVFMILFALKVFGWSSLSWVWITLPLWTMAWQVFLFLAIVVVKKVGKA